MIAGSLNPLTAAAVPAEGGYRLSGIVNYASGSITPTGSGSGLGGARRYLVLIDGIPELIAGIIPISEATILDTWSPSGMRATGSDDCRVDDVFVAERFTFPWGDGATRSDDVWSRIPLFVQIGACPARPRSAPLGVPCAPSWSSRSEAAVGQLRPARRSPAGPARRGRSRGSGPRRGGHARHRRRGRVAAGRGRSTIRAHRPRRLPPGPSRRPGSPQRPSTSCMTSAACPPWPWVRPWSERGVTSTRPRSTSSSTARFEITGRILLGHDPGSPVI